MRMCRRANPNDRWDDFIDALAAGHSGRSDRNYSAMEPTEKANFVNELGSIAQYDKEKQHNARKGAIMCHEHTSAYEGAVPALTYWRILTSH